MAGETLLPHSALVMSSTRCTETRLPGTSRWGPPPRCSLGGDTVRWWQSRRIRPWVAAYGAWRHQRRWWDSGHSGRCSSPDGPRCARSGQPVSGDSVSFSSSSFRVSSTLLRTNSLIWPLITFSFSCTIFSDIVCCLLSNVCVVTSFYQSLQAMSSFMRFSICATYCTLSYESGRIAWIYGETKLSGKIYIQRSCFSSYYCSSTAQLYGKLHGVFCIYRIFMRNTDKWTYSH